MAADAVDLAHVEALENALINNETIDQKLANRTGLDVKFLQKTAEQVWKVLEGSDLFAPLRSYADTRYMLSTQKWLEMAEAKGLGSILCLRFGGQRKQSQLQELTNELTTWMPTLRLKKWDMVRVIDYSEVEVFLTKDNSWIVYRGPIDDNPDVEFMSQFSDVTAVCNFLRALDLGGYRFEVPSPALALADQLLSFTEEYHSRLEAKTKVVHGVIEERAAARQWFADWRPLI